MEGTKINDLDGIFSYVGEMNGYPYYRNNIGIVLWCDVDGTYYTGPDVNKIGNVMFYGGLSDNQCHCRKCGFAFKCSKQFS